MRRARLLALLLASTLSGCMVLDLAGDLESSPCASDGDCAHLEDSSPTSACGAWRCAEDARCHVAIVDADGDGSPAATCTGDEADDCDDQDAAIGPGAVEVSNDRDDDCDGVVDEVVVMEPEEVIRHSSLGLLAISRATRGPANEDGCITFVERDATGVGAARQLDVDDGIPATGIVRVLHAAEVALDARAIDSQRIATDQLAIAAVPSGECERVVLAVASESTTTPARSIARFVDSSGTHFDRGIPDAAGNDCRATGVAHAARAPTILVQGGDGLVLWLAAPSALDDCSPVTNVPVLAHRVGISGTTASVGDTAASVLGMTDDASAPAVIAVPGYGFVIAFVDDGSLVFSRVTMGPSDSLIATVILRSPMPESATVARPVLTLGPSVDGAPTLGVLARTGSCGLGDPVFARILLAGGPTDPVPTRFLGTVVTRLAAGGDGAMHDQDHALVYADAPRGYWAAWVDSNALFVRHVRDDGVVIGDAPRVFRSSRIAAWHSITLLGPVSGETPSLTVIASATLTSGPNVLVQRRFVFP